MSDSFSTSELTSLLRRRCILALAALTLTLGSSSAAADASTHSGWLSDVGREIAREEYAITWQERTDPEGLGPAWQAPNRAQGIRTYFTNASILVVARTEKSPSWEWRLGLLRLGRGEAVLAAAPGGSEVVEQVSANRIEIARGSLVEWSVNDPRGLEHGFTLQDRPSGEENAGAALPVWIELFLGGSVTPVVSTDGQATDFVTEGGVRVIHAALSVLDAHGQPLPSRAEAIEGGLRLVIDDRGAIYPVVASLLATSPSWSAEEDRVDVAAGATGSSTGAGWTANGSQDGGNFGISVGTAGDVNGDGFADIIVGAYLYDNGQNNEGRALVYHGSAAGPQAAPSWTAENNEPLSSFGLSVGTAGDVNGDGYDDVIVGATRHDDGQEDEGGAWLYLGSAAGLATTAAWTAESNLEYSRFGGSVGTAGDVNGDGYADVIVGARFFGEAQTDRGKAFVYHGSSSGLSPVANWSREGAQNNQQLASSVGTAGDVNGDGYADVIVGSSGSNSTFVFHGSATGLSAAPAWTAQIGQAVAAFGSSAGTAGDVNGDGYADVIVGALLFDNGQTDEGGAFLYHGSPAGLASAPAWTAEGDQAGAQFGNSARTAGDVNGDGYSDVIVGAPLYDNVESAEGRAFVYHGSPAGLTTGSAWTAESDQAAANLGRSVAGAGDVNGDGYADVIAGAPTFDDTQSDEGRVYLYFGGGAAPGRVQMLLAAKSGADVQLSWSPACPAPDYAIYEGMLGSFTSHAPRFCSTDGATSKTFTPASGSVYFLVVPLSGPAEGSYGTAGSGTERPVGSSACRPQQLGGCS